MKKLRHKRNVLVEAEEKRRDLGFGTQITDPDTRLLNRDGSFNVKRVGGTFWGQIDIFNQLIICSWKRFFSLILAFYLVLNLIFAFIYQAVGIEFLLGADQTNTHSRFMDAFFFSSQTLTTVGYGRIAPIGFWASTVAAIESLLGLLIFALATSLLYGRFSRPVAKILYSNKAVIAPYLDITGFMFRIVNEQSRQLIDIQVEVAVSMLEKQENGKFVRRYYGLNLERSKVNFFPANWTIVHPITDSSPIFGKSKDDLLESDAEFLVLIKGTEETYNQTVNSRTSFHVKEVIVGAKFLPMFSDVQGAGVITLDLNKLSDIQEVPLVSQYLPSSEASV
jgi:inward rectifier potassium channel